jgi:hypothetical protein
MTHAQQGEALVGDVVDLPQLIVTSYYGAAVRRDERRWLLVMLGDTDYCVLTREQIRKLAIALLREADNW